MKSLIIIPNEAIMSRIFLIRGKKIMLDKDLAQLYYVETRSLNQAVKRNLDRFPNDFMFKLNADEIEDLVSQNVIPSKQILGGQYPYAFTEQGVAMLSSVLKSKQAVYVNIQIIRTFTKLREILADNQKLARKIEQMERKYDKHIYEIFEVLKRLTVEEERPKGKIGFTRSGK